MSKQGVNLVGFAKGEIGLGEGCRLLARALMKSGVPFSVYDVQIPGAMPYGDTSLRFRIRKGLPYSTDIIHMNPPEMEWLFETRSQHFNGSRRTIGFWLWELEQLPETWLKSFRLVDEVWTPSEFIAGTLRKYTDKPVRVTPYPILPPPVARRGRDYFELPPYLTLFLAMFDAQSTIERKNPLGAIRAYKAAFGDYAGHTGLVIKVNNPNPETMALIHKETQGLANVHVISGTRPRKEVGALIQCCDVFVSLHRAEGFGLVIAEAMRLGKAVIATNWSANTEFMCEGACCPTGYTLTDVPEGIQHYGGLGQWAEPDVMQAAEFMWRLAYEKDYRQTIKKAAVRHTEAHHSVREAGKRLQDAFQQMQNGG